VPDNRQPILFWEVISPWRQPTIEVKSVVAKSAIQPQTESPCGFVKERNEPDKVMRDTRSCRARISNRLGLAVCEIEDDRPSAKKKIEGLK
jgi:hypothetical protein